MPNGFQKNHSHKTEFELLHVNGEVENDPISDGVIVPVVLHTQ